VEAQLLGWFDANGRDLPWRHTKDPYATLVSEVMLQQYRVENVETLLCSHFRPD
jgi:A/G-specific adenine glycosylase